MRKHRKARTAASAKGLASWHIRLGRPWDGAKTSQSVLPSAGWLGCRRGSADPAGALNGGSRYARSGAFNGEGGTGAKGGP